VFRTICIALLVAGSSFGKQSDQTKALQEKLTAMANQHQGKVALFAEKLATGETVAIDPDAVVQTASVIKLPIFVEAFAQIKAGKHSLAEKVVLRKEDQVQGSGVLQFLRPPLELSFEDVLTLMVIESDNTATNLVIDKVGLKNVNDRIASMGLKSTYLYKKVYKPPEGPMPPDQKKYGLGKTTPREMAQVMASMERCDAKSAIQDQLLCDRMVQIMQNQQYRNMIPHYLEAAVDTSESGSFIADKVGQLDAVRADVALIYSQDGPIVISAFTYDNKDKRWIYENEGELLIARMAKEIAATWAPHGLGKPKK
jgi:beta-lactamase class A